MAGIFDVLQAANYQRGGGKGRKPKPLQRPGDEPESKPLLQGDSMTPAELDAELERRYVTPPAPGNEEVSD